MGPMSPLNLKYSLISRSRGLLSVLWVPPALALELSVVSAARAGSSFLGDLSMTDRKNCLLVLSECIIFLHKNGSNISPNSTSMVFEKMKFGPWST